MSMAATLVLIELDRQQVKRASLHAITLARQLGGDYALLVLGHDLDKIAAALVGHLHDHCVATRCVAICWYERDFSPNSLGPDPLPRTPEQAHNLLRGVGELRS